MKWYEVLKSLQDFLSFEMNGKICAQFISKNIHNKNLKRRYLFMQFYGNYESLT